MAPNKIDYRKPLRITAIASRPCIRKKEKYERCPVMPDAVPGHDSAQGWGFVVAGCFLVEESFKALAHVRGKSVPTKHSLTMLFGLLDHPDQDVLRHYYLDFRATIGGNLARFPFATLDEFLTNLDGDPKPQGDDYLGSFDWRYFLIENERSQQMPTVSVEFLHEVAYGVIVILERARGGADDPRTQDRKAVGTRLQGRFDYFLFRGTAQMVYGFGPIPEHLGLRVIDMRAELALPETPSF